MAEKLTAALAKMIFDQITEGDRAAALQNQMDITQYCVPYVIDLSTARTAQNPFVIGFPFRSCFIRTATDSLTNVNMRLDAPDDAAGDISLKNNDSFVLPFRAAKAFLNWTAQSGKSITLLIFPYGEFRSGSQVSSTAGGVSITTGDSVTTNAVATVTTATAQLFASDSSRKMMVIYNHGAVSIFIGGSTVTDQAGANPGIEIPPGGSYEWDSTAACYACTDTTTNALISTTRFS